jgi:hypothetical protein
MATAQPVAAGPGGDGGGPGWTLDLDGLAGNATNPLVVWLITTTGGLAMFLGLVRRYRDEPETDGLVLAVASSDSAVDVARHEPPPRPTGRATMLPPVPPRVFDRPPAKGVQRTKIGYRRVRISSKPDALRSVERGRLERGDEVEILDSYEGFLEIRTPDGITGWILRHTTVGGASINSA